MLSHLVRRMLLLSCAILAGNNLVRGADEPQVADLILLRGKIVTVNDQFALAEALAVKGDRLLAVGSNAEIEKLRGPQTQAVDLGGKTVIPGLIDSHVHPTGASMYEFDHPIPEMETVGDVLTYVAGRAAQLEPGQWISLRQVFITRLRDQRYPTRAELDQAAPKNPVVFATGPDAMLNSLALAASKIGKDFKVPEGSSGQVELDPQGEPTGMLRSCSRIIKSQSNGKSATDADRYERLKQMLANYNQVGLTSICDRDSGPGGITLYRALREKQELTCRVFINHNLDSSGDWEAVEKRIIGLANDPLHAYNNQLWLRGIKMYLDGGMLTGSAYMRQPWGVSQIYSIADPEYRGLRFIPQERLVQVVRSALQHDLQVTAHSVGDGAVHALIDAYAEVNREFPVRDKRPCVTHSNFMSREAIETMRELGVVADLQPAWLFLDGRTLQRQFGDERLAYFQPYQTLFERGVIIGGGSDHMQRMGDMRSVNPYNPFWGMWITLTRQPRWTDAALHPEQIITREQALRLYTINNAFLTFEEKEKGSLEPGKLADFAVLRQDLLTCPLDEVKTVQVERTYLGGKLVYQRE